MTKSTSNKVEQFNVYWQKLSQSSRYHPANRYRYYLLKSLLPKFIKSPSSILDIGCGDGELLLVLSKIFPSANLFGCDISQTQIKLNQQRYTDISFLQADASKPNLEILINEANIAKFDLVTSSEVIEHVINDRCFLQNVSKVLKPGGIFFLTTQSGKLYKMDRNILGHLRHYKLDNLCDMVEETGIKVIKAFSTGFPILSLQKIIVECFFHKITSSLASGNKPSFLIRSICKMMFLMLCAAPRIGGPQLIIVGIKNR